MQAERLKILQKAIEEEPEVPFNHYALALEYLPINNEKALELFEYLLEKHPTYLATYYMTGKLLEELDYEDRALGIYEQGIELAIKQKKAKAEEELKRAFKNLEDEMLF